MNIRELEDKYVGTKLKFSTYYKYSFSYSGKTEDGNTLVCMWGQGSDDIYRYSVSADDVETFHDVSSWHDVVLYSPDGAVLFEWHD